MEYITTVETKVPVIAKVDVVVVRAGPAGVGAAVRAAQYGADTVVIERLGSPGGIVTNRLMSVIEVACLGRLAIEIVDRLRTGGYVVDLCQDKPSRSESPYPLEKFPGLYTNPLLHYHRPLCPARPPLSPLLVFDPDMASGVMNDIMEASGVKILFRNLFVDTKVEGDTIEAIIVENASGKQAIESKVFVDVTGRGDVVARAGAPYMSPANELGFPMPPGLFWKMSGVDIDRLFEYQKEAPKLDVITEEAKAKGELPFYRPKKTAKGGSVAYTGHPKLDHPAIGNPNIHNLGFSSSQF